MAFVVTAGSTATEAAPARYAARLAQVLAEFDWSPVDRLADMLDGAWKSGRTVFICGNGGSAANAIHWANDFSYPVAKRGGRGLRVIALPANTAVVTCLANDIDYQSIFSYQIETMGSPDDILVVLSGSGNSANILQAVKAARALRMKTAGVFGFEGGLCRSEVDLAIHFKINDMQIAEDLQIIVNHMVMQALQRRSEAAH